MINRVLLNAGRSSSSLSSTRCGCTPTIRAKQAPMQIVKESFFPNQIHEHDFTVTMTRSSTPGL